MSVLIKGVKMPTSCYYCGLTDTSFINCQAFFPSRLLEDDCEERRPEWCPLAELPEHHGRLIDANVLATESLKDGAYGYVSTKQIYDAETIIEAE